MAKNGQKEVINLSFLNKNNKPEEQPKLPELNKNNEIAHSSEEKKDVKENLPKLCLKKDNNNINNNLLNQKRERTQNHGKEAEEEINNNNNINNTNNIVNNAKKKMSVNEAKKEMKEFELLILKTAKEIETKYGIVFPDLSFEDNLPDEIKNKLIDNLLESPKIKKILTEMNSQK